MSSLFYFIREALIGFKRNLSTAMGSIVTIFLSLLMIGFFVIGAILVNNIMSNVESEVVINCYIADGTQETDVNTLREQIKTDDRVKDISYTTKDDALKKFEGSLGSSPEVIATLEGQNPLPASLDVELNRPQDVKDVAELIKNNPLFLQIADDPSNPDSSIKYGQQAVDKLFALTGVLRVVGIVVVALLIFIAMIFINNTIRLAILARKREISIMRLVGASNGFIRGPFFMESVLHSLIGALGTILVLETLRSFALPALRGWVSWLPLDLTLETFLFIYLILVIAGLIIGLIGSALSMRRYLSV